MIASYLILDTYYPYLIFMFSITFSYNSLCSHWTCGDQLFVFSFFVFFFTTFFKKLSIFFLVFLIAHLPSFFVYLCFPCFICYLIYLFLVGSGWFIVLNDSTCTKIIIKIYWSSNYCTLLLYNRVQIYRILAFILCLFEFSLF